MFPQLTADQQARVADEILLFTARTSRKPLQVEEDSVTPAERVA
jgi:hypothetical protein